MAALGGMITPALIFLGFNYNNPESIQGWAIPSATDIAFALAVLTLLGKGIPPAIKIFLLAVAVFDDLGAILIIAAFYNTGLAAIPLMLAIAGIAALILLNRAHVVVITPYILVGIFLWFCFYYSGIHTTLAGVIVGLMIPMRDSQDKNHSPLNSCMHFLHPWVSFLVLPIFAFTSAGVDLKGLSFSSLLAPLPLGIALGLFIGKQIGIFGTAWLLIKSRIVSMPEGAAWRHLYTVSIIAGIGFTMSLFIGMLAFSEAHLQEMVKVGVISGSLLCVLWGGIVLRMIK
jgi:NhaA family Na+:H+ antiporter